MTRKDYELIGDVMIKLDAKIGPRVWHEIYKEFVSSFIVNLPNFNMVKFDKYVKSAINASNHKKDES